MRNAIFVLGFLALASCAPGKSNKVIFFDIYCDSCHVKVRNEWSEGSGPNKAQVIEIPFEGIVNDYKRVEFNRFDSPNSCVRPLDFVNYGADTSWIYIIEDNDTIAILDNGGNGYCY